MTRKVAYVFAFMLIIDLLASCSKPNTYQVEINKSYMNLRNFVTNKPLVEDDVVNATELEATMQYEYIQTASNFEIPSLLSTSAYASDENNWVFQNNYESILVLAKAKSGSDRNITSDCKFIFKGVTYTAEELIARLNTHLQGYDNSTSSPSIGFKVQFSSNLAQQENQLIKINTTLSNTTLLNTSFYLDIN
jgi:hypothetical protein